MLDGCKPELIQNAEKEIQKNLIDGPNLSNIGLNKYFVDIYNDLDYSNKPITITANTNITYIEPKLDILPTSRRYLLEANPSIPNGKRKTIINNINLSKDVILEIYCLNNNNQGGFFINEHEYNTYFFASKGEDLELIWNSSLNKWNVIKYNSLFRNI